MPKGEVKLRSMKIDPKEMEEQLKPKSITESMPAYPYGLRVHLDDDSLKKLGLDKLPKVGSSKYLGARVEIVSVSESESRNGDGGNKHRSVELQITDMGLDSDESTDAAETLYNEPAAE